MRRASISHTLPRTLTHSSVLAVAPSLVKSISPLRWSQKLSSLGRQRYRTRQAIAQLNFQMVPTIKISRSSSLLTTQRTRKDREDTSHAEELRVIWKVKKLSSQEMSRATLASSNLYGQPRTQVSNSCAQILRSLEETLKTAQVSA